MKQSKLIEFDLFQITILNFSSLMAFEFECEIKEGMSLLATKFDPKHVTHSQINIGAVEIRHLYYSCFYIFNLLNPFILKIICLKQNTYILEKIHLYVHIELA